MNDQTPLEACDNLQKRTLVECAKKGLNPNSNAPGVIKPLTDAETVAWSEQLFGKLKSCKV